LAKIFPLEKIPAYSTGRNFKKLLVVISDVHVLIMSGDELCQVLRGLPASRIAIAGLSASVHDQQLLRANEEAKGNHTTLDKDRERCAGMS
jgi:CheY-like chemotaxis protein